MLATAKEGRKNAIEESQYHKGAMESRYDTFKEEAQYLMVAQDARIAELNSTIAVLKPLLEQQGTLNTKVGVFSLVELEDDTGSTASYLILPAGGGISFTLKEKTVTTLNEASPLARAIYGKSEGDEAELSVVGNIKTFSIISIF